MLDLYQSLGLFLNLQFVHSLDCGQKKELLRKADLFVMPSLDYETFGLTVIESMSFGIPVICSNSGALPETVGLVDSKLLFQSGSVEDLTKKIMWFYNLTKERREELRRKGIDVVKENFSYKTNTSQLVNFYDSIN